jgi:hypothetical protein
MSGSRARSGSGESAPSTEKKPRVLISISTVESRALLRFFENDARGDSGLIKIQSSAYWRAEFDWCDTSSSIHSVDQRCLPDRGHEKHNRPKSPPAPARECIPDSAR